jgi:hypothetical protein
MKSATKIQGFSRGDVVVLVDEAIMFFDAARANVLHEVVDVTRAGYRIAPVKGAFVDWERAILAMPEDIRPYRA